MSVLNYLLGQTEIKSESGYFEFVVDGEAFKNYGHYVLDIQDEGSEIRVTVDFIDYERKAECLFNETYFTDTFGGFTGEQFSLEQLSADLHAQHLHEVDHWIVDFVKSKAGN